MTRIRTVISYALLTSLVALGTGCVFHEHDRGAERQAHEQGYAEGYYDRDHSRYWHENAWHDCVVNDPYCH